MSNFRKSRIEYLQQKQANDARAWFKLGYDTQQIAYELGVKEALVYNTLSRSKYPSYEYEAIEPRLYGERP